MQLWAVNRNTNQRAYRWPDVTDMDAAVKFITESMNKVEVQNLVIVVTGNRINCFWDKDFGDNTGPIHFSNTYEVIDNA